MRTKEEYDEDIELLRSLKQPGYKSKHVKQTNIESDIIALKSLKYDKKRKYPDSCDWRRAREELGLSQTEWEDQVGDIPGEVTNIVCFLSFKDRVRYKLGIKPKGKITYRAR